MKAVVAMSVPYAGQTIDHEYSADDSLMGEHSRHLVQSANFVAGQDEVGSG
jgi:hypothetical protein